jgi:signal transduction histidine kinase
MMVGPEEPLMKAQCVMCGRDIAQGILCEKCDRPKRSSSKQSSQTAAPAPSAPSPPPAAAAPSKAPAAALQPQEDHEPDPFPKAPIVPFPVESTSLAMTSMYEVLSTAGVPSVLIAGDRSVKFVSESARALLRLAPGEAVTTRIIESRLNHQLPSLQESHASTITLEGRKVRLSVIPLSGGASGSVLIFKTEHDDSSDSATLTFIQETVLTPLMSLQAALSVAVSKGRQDPLLHDAVSTIEQILSSLELSPRQDLMPQRTRRPVADVLRHIVSQAGPAAANKQVKLQLDAPETDETFLDASRLEQTLASLVDNAIHYVPHGGQVVLGLRFLEHKGSPLLLFFVMDNGPVVPEAIRSRIFDADFAPSADGGRSGKNLPAARDFAAAHGGQIWVESKTGKACTFFLRLAPEA